MTKTIKKTDWGYETYDDSLKGNQQCSAAVGLYPLSANLTEDQKKELDQKGELKLKE